ncbi:hypothetical protein CK203_038942 [Vitis vinifera]|uniref:Uncharacterized protein n=1 Tax=Vitis vinifera TaxID=29760 RepID=A0A438HFZ5_VITVI|nr:hypothetical protein CK203_038942 [Vitis vinifera]
MVAGKKYGPIEMTIMPPEVPFYSPKTPSSQLPFPIYPLLSPSDPQASWSSFGVFCSGLAKMYGGGFGFG